MTAFVLKQDCAIIFFTAIIALFIQFNLSVLLVRLFHDACRSAGIHFRVRPMSLSKVQQIKEDILHTGGRMVSESETSVSQVALLSDKFLFQLFMNSIFVQIVPCRFSDNNCSFSCAFCIIAVFMSVEKGKEGQEQT
jgi:hypothetical protein